MLKLLPWLLLALEVTSAASEGFGGGWSSSPLSNNSGLASVANEQKVNWMLAYKTTSYVDEGSEQGWDAETIREAWASCNVHYAAIKYEIKGQVHSIYRRTHGPDSKTGVSAWKKGACGQCDGFDPVELITGCWVSKQRKSGAPNSLNTDFQMFSNEKDYFDRSAGLTPWKSCNYDDCNIKVGYPRDCGAEGPVPYRWHGFSGGNTGGQTDVAFYISVCNGWKPPAIELGNPIGSGWDFIYIVVLLGLGYFVGGAVLGARRRGERVPTGPKLFKVHPHYGKWMELHGLVQDGVNYSRGYISGKGGKGRGGYQPVPSTATRENVQVTGRSSGSGKSKRSSNEAKQEVEKSKKKDKKGTKTSKDSKTTGDSPSAVLAKSMSKEKERMLQEERSAGVHSSQQAIKVTLS